MKYRIDSMELRTESSESRVVVSVTNQSAASSDVVLVTAYTSGEQYQWMVLDDVRNLAIGTTTEITLPVDLSAGTVAELKVFVVTSLTNPAPPEQQQVAVTVT